MNATVKPSQVTAEQIERIRFLRADGLPARSIAADLGLRTTVVETICERHSIPSTFRKIVAGTKPDDHDPRMIRRAIIKHLQDIHREHGYDKTWDSHDIPAGTATDLPRVNGFQLSSTGIGGLAGCSR